MSALRCFGITLLASLAILMFVKSAIKDEAGRHPESFVTFILGLLPAYYAMAIAMRIF